MAEHSLADLPSPLEEASNASARTEARRAAAGPAKPYFAEVQRRRSMGHPVDDKIRKQWSGACSSVFDCGKLASSK
ncbi:MAG: hypothetical protein HUU21_33995 [Polyangiaceae bacterium]|nr:hypothetical protein [Polyangiaceae bacterium]